MTSSSATLVPLTTPDGHALTAYRFDPERPARAGLVIAPGMAISQSFYAGFAAFMARRGYRVWTFDYRGIGESWRGSMRDCTADISDWIERDFDTVVRHASDDLKGLPLFVLGHSLGGQAVPLLPSADRLDGVVTIAVGSGSMRHNTPRTRRNAPWLWYLLAPVLCRLFGYFPGARIGVMGDIPRRAMFQWRRWCLTPEYLFSGEAGARAAYARARFPVLGLIFNDDELLLETGSRMLHDAYTAAEVDYRVVDPEPLGFPRIGHFGFFRSNQEASLWPVVCQWVDQQCTRLGTLAPAPVPA